jgi:hypothetical protein
LDFRSCQECDFGKAFYNLSFVSFYIYIFLLVTVDMTFLYILYMFSIILFIVYFDYMPSIVRMSLYSNTRSYSAHSLTSSVSGQHRVSMDLRCCLPVNAPYILGHVVDRTSDTPVESFVDPLPEYRTSRT